LNGIVINVHITDKDIFLDWSKNAISALFYSGYLTIAESTELNKNNTNQENEAIENKELLLKIPNKEVHTKIREIFNIDIFKSNY